MQSRLTKDPGHCVGGDTRRCRRIARRLFAGALFAAAVTGEAVEVPSTAANGDAPASAELMRPGLYRINGIGGGMLLRSSTDGLVVVDSGRPGSYQLLMTEIQRIAKSADPQIRAVVLTSASAEQVGNVVQFVEAGVPVIVQQRALARLAGNFRATRARLVSYDTDYVLRVADFQIEVEHVGRGRTGADSFVVFRELRVVGIGELFTTETPEPECSTGGSFAGWAAAIDHLLWSDFEVAVPSRGAPVGKHELEAFKAKLEALAARAAASPSGPSDCRPQR
jgi:glyoxylase-like metal-dependent hydrolase (beta-lactamase superfamily II)